MRISDWSSDVCSSDLAMICDGDQGGNDHIDQLRSHNFTEAEITDLVTQLPAGIDLEQLIIGSALRPCMLAAARELDPTIVDDDQAILTFAAANKEVIAVRTGAQIRLTADRADIPEQFRSEERRVGKECGRTCRYGGWPVN